MIVGKGFEVLADNGVNYDTRHYHVYGDGTVKYTEYITGQSGRVGRATIRTLKIRPKSLECWEGELPHGWPTPTYHNRQMGQPA